MAGKKLEGKKTLSQKQIKDLKGSFGRENFSELASKLQETLCSLENICLDMGITGEAGAGKSTFINSFRDLHEEDEGAAPTGRGITNTDPTPYPHPKYANVVLWDLPSIGTPNFQAKNYLEQVHASRYDFFVIIASQLFTSLHAKVANQIQKAGKDFYFVRSKVDVDLEAARLSNPSRFNEALALQKIREGCVKGFQGKAAAVAPNVFLISNSQFSKYDFPLLVEALEKNLQLQKSHSFLLATPNVSHRILERKKNAMAEHLWLVSVVACGHQAEPIPEISVACNVDLLVQIMRGYCISFGLEESALRKVAEHTDQPLEKLQALVKSPLATEVTKALVMELLADATSKGPKLPKQLVPMASPGMSFSVVYNVLKTFVDSIVADAHRILVKVFVSHRASNESGPSSESGAEIAQVLGS
ncbi:interferon-inducible GTPase 5-like [Elgaria multicarinata webbii]|uniref:interferon-inducible GTPase 5-like n=1 Tax=Elgaria multicarinata webbii TaxID=159646 RepID=UPI002FCCFC2F